MRTKTVLLTTLLGAVSIASSVAQTVYSVNAVGYVNITVPKGGFALLANPLNQPTNSIAAVLPDAPKGTRVYVISSTTGQFVTVTKLPSGSWSAADTLLAPGTGFFVKNSDTANDLPITFVGEVPQGTVTVPYAAGFNLIGSIVPQAGKLETDLGFTSVSGDRVYRYDSAAQNYVSASTSHGNKNWTGGKAGETEPQIGVAEGFWLNAKAAGTWTRNFTVQQ
jgi:hypothetical protein